MKFFFKVFYLKVYHTFSLQGLDDNSESFITEVFSGCVRYNSVLNVVTGAFFVKDGKRVLRSEENLYKGNVLLFGIL